MNDIATHNNNDDIFKNSGWVADLLQFFLRGNADVHITSPDVPSVVDVRH